MASLESIKLGNLNKDSFVSKSEQISDYVGNIVSADGISFGKYSNIGNLSSIAIGLCAETHNVGQSIAIGYEAKANNYGVAVGKGAYSDYGVAIGPDSLALSNTSLALGRYAAASAEFAVQLNGDRDKNIVNELSGTLKFYNGKENITIVNQDGKIPTEVIAGGIVSSVNCATPVDGNITLSTLSVNLGSANTPVWFNNGVVTQCNEICSSTEIKAKVDELDDAISTKIFIKDPAAKDAAVQVGAYNQDLSVIKMPIEEYELSVVGGTLSDNVLYVVSSDYIDAYEQEIRALSTPDVEGVSNAANTLYVNKKFDEVDTKFNDKVREMNVKLFLSNDAGDTLLSIEQVSGLVTNGMLFEISDCFIANDAAIAQSKINNLTTDQAYLSTTISTKIFLKDPTVTDDDALKDGTYGRDLSVIKIPIEEYELSVVGGTLSNGVLYVVDGNYVDMYGQQLCSLSTPGIDGTSNAANTLYVNDLIDDVNVKFVEYTKTTELTTFLSNHLKDFFVKVPVDGIDESGNPVSYQFLSCKLAF